MKALFEELRERVARHAPNEGNNPTPYAGLYVFRADTPFGPSRMQTGGVVVAVVTDRQKDVTFADGRTVGYGAGSYLFVTRETQYTSHVRAASRRRPYLSLGLQLPPEQIAEVVLELDDAGAAAGDEDLDGWVGRLDQELLDAFVRLLRSVDDPAARRLVTPLVVRELIVRLLRSDHAGPLRRVARTDDGRIRDAMAFIREHAEQRLTIERIARQVAMSPSHFAHRFRAIARVSPMRYAKQVRLHRARLLMLHDGLRAAEAATEVGYASPSQFTRDFKAAYGAPPGSYVQRLRS